jgi:hypothetical protein
MVETIVRATGGKLEYVMDCVSAEETLKRIAHVVSPQATVAMLLPIKAGDSLVADNLWMELPADRSPFEKTVKVIGVRTFLYQQVFQDFCQSTRGMLIEFHRTSI